MSSTSLTAANVMDKSASLMNDTAKTVYTYTAQMPYLNMALAELEEHFQLNNVPITNQTSTAITIPIGITSVNPTDGGGIVTPPNYPVDLVEIQQIGERQYGTTDSFIPLTRRDNVPALGDISINSIHVWAWEDQRIKFPPAVTIRELKIDYIKSLFTEVTSENDAINVINAKSFLFYRTAALCSQFVGENESRAAELNGFAILALDRVTGIGTKAKQSINTRRRPFMSAYKRRTNE